MDLSALLAPRNSEHARLAAEIFASREDLQRIFGAADSAGFRQWLAVHGRREYGAPLDGYYPPLPPEELRATASCGVDLPMHLQSGFDDFRTILELYEVLSGRPATGLQRVLDFGCGCGRLLHWFELALPDVHRGGVDVRRASVDWLRANMQGEFHLGEVHPPSALPDASMDLITSLSVFSHLSRASNLAWIGELARIVRPGGLVILTTHGAFALAAMLRSEELRALLEITVDQAAHYLRRFEQEHFLFHLASADTLRRADGVEPDYGQTFFDAAFVRAHWSEHFELLACVPAAHVFLQDVYVLRRPGQP